MKPKLTNKPKTTLTAIDAEIYSRTVKYCEENNHIIWRWLSAVLNNRLNELEKQQNENK